MDEKQPLGQPINDKPGDAQYVPQPLGGSSSAPKSNKTLWMIIAGAVGLLLLFGVAYWFMSKNAAEDYKTDAAAYKQAILTERDALNAELDDNNIGASSPEAKSVFEEHGKKLQEIAANAPETPKVMGLPVAVDQAQKEEIEQLTKATNDYANALLSDVAIYNYYIAVTEAFEPIKNLGTITVMNRDKIMSFGTLWPEFLATFKTITPPAELQAMHTDLIAQGTAIDEKTKPLVANFDANTETANDLLLGELTPLTKEFNTTFVDGITTASKASYEAVNDTYDKLDEALTQA